MDAASHLFVAFAVKGKTARDGVTKLNDKADVMGFLNAHILPILKASSAVHPVLQADAISFSTTFRAQVSARECERERQVHERE
jgi:hypothetical protein